MPDDKSEKNGDSPVGSEVFRGRPIPPDYKGYPERRNGKDRRSGADRRKRKEKKPSSEQMSGQDRRKYKRRGLHLTIPIFIKLAALSTLLTFLLIFSISMSMLRQQRKQFTAQLIDQGESMARSLAHNARDKLLGEEDLALFQLVDDVVQNEQVLYALIVDNKNNVKAHSRMDAANKPYKPPKTIRFIKGEEGETTQMISHGGKEALFFTAPIVYQKLNVGKVRLAISQEKVLETARTAKVFLWVMAAIITFLGIVLSVILGIYFSRPIKRLGEGAKALGLGHFDHRVDIKRNDELGDLAFAFNRMAEDLEINEKIKASFGRYVTPEIVEKILANPDDRWMKGAKVEVTVLFVDIRGFMAFSENIDSERLVDLLNDYFTRVTDVALKEGGHINKFVGDEAMIVFGAPVPNPDHAKAAVRAALEIQKEIARLNQERKLGHEDIRIGIGINSGEMVAGNLGSQRKMEYTVIGDHVNIASRLTSLAEAGEILVSSWTYDLFEDKEPLRVEERGRVPVKGRREEVIIYNVLEYTEEAQIDDQQG
jgi:adenylate cyclase